MIITISGKQGAGKTTVTEELSKALGYDFVSVGNLQGEIATEKGITINELMELGKTDKSIHIDMDKKTVELGKIKDNFIIDGWIAFHFIPHAYKIFLMVKEYVGAERIFYSERKDEPKAETIEKTKEMLEKRLADVQESFKKYYNLDFLDSSHQDLVIDTTNLTVQQVIESILKGIKSHNHL